MHIISFFETTERCPTLTLSIVCEIYHQEPFTNKKALNEITLVF